MYDIEMVCVTKIGNATRVTDRLADYDEALSITNRQMREITGEKILNMANVVQSYGTGTPFTLSAACLTPGGGIVGFVNINEVVGE
ncbi:hypothetical protein PBI_MRMAGOO_158 [Mycobacterium phage MrMagoo]|uniref:Uncharacterized protein n=1 Tax=Mycobacterium phage MrMagoo TaxID=1927020 RepID=A0A1L6BYR8_9CAUD|nr:hypothetical protein J4U04_gp122 [Mycobacterium phage MrMagoo]APQ42240.1 hypothetical protein PBI_MRMAGOO_158 [Mycobacterium phage MrMagoo]ARM70309.1 hypothetical protein SEA_GARDENSALSA_156 [Mycobacterium phage GardenSalsa]